MRGIASTTRSGLPRSYRRRRLRGIAIVVAALAACFGGVTLWIVMGHGKSEGWFPGAKEIPLPPDPPTPKTVKLLPKEARDLHTLIRRFVYTAVARKNLAQSYRLIGPALRENLSFGQWTHGQTTVQPFPVDAKTTLAFEKPDWTYARSVRFELHVVTPDRPNQVRNMGTDTFFCDVIKVRGRWLVNNWMPRWTPPIPNSNG